LRALKQELEQLLLASLGKLTGSVLAQMPAASTVVVERTRDNQHGEFATNLALRLAKPAAGIRASLRPPSWPRSRRVPCSRAPKWQGPDFINFHLAPEAYARELARIHALGGAYGESSSAGRAGAGGVRVREPDRAAARGSWTPGGLRRDAREHSQGGGV